MISMGSSIGRLFCGGPGESLILCGVRKDVRCPSSTMLAGRSCRKCFAARRTFVATLDKRLVSGALLFVNFDFDSPGVSCVLDELGFGCGRGRGRRCYLLGGCDLGSFSGYRTSLRCGLEGRRLLVVRLGHCKVAAVLVRRCSSVALVLCRVREEFEGGSVFVSKDTRRCAPFDGLRTRGFIRLLTGSVVRGKCIVVGKFK